MFVLDLVLFLESDWSIAVLFTIKHRLFYVSLHNTLSNNINVCLFSLILFIEAFKVEYCKRLSGCTCIYRRYIIFLQVSPIYK